MQTSAIDDICRREGRKILAGLIRRFGDFDLAEDILQDAYAKALETWAVSGLPDNPAAWLTTVAYRRGLDLVRRDSKTAADSDAILQHIPCCAQEPQQAIEDDQLRLIFTCCHPALAEAAQIALALRTLCGLSTGEIARAFIEPESTTAQRIVRAKRKISAAGIPYEVPAADALPERLAIVLKVIYLVFNEGYSSSGGQALLRVDLCVEAIRLGHLMTELMPDKPEALGLLALMLLQHARSDARVSSAGELITLEQQDRSCWNRADIQSGLATLDRALSLHRPGPYQIQAAIAALHMKAARAEDTDWPQISALYNTLLRYWPAPAVELNAAVALAMAHDMEAGLGWIKQIEARDILTRSPYLHAAKAELLRRLSRHQDAALAYRQALIYTTNQVERNYLEQRLHEVGGSIQV